MIIRRKKIKNRKKVAHRREIIEAHRRKIKPDIDNDDDDDNDDDMKLSSIVEDEKEKKECIVESLLQEPMTINFRNKNAQEEDAQHDAELNGSKGSLGSRKEHLKFTQSFALPSARPLLDDKTSTKRIAEEELHDLMMSPNT